MILLEYRLAKVSSNQLEYIQGFNQYLINNIYDNIINTKFTRTKIMIRLKNIDKKVNWIRWTNNIKSIDIDDLMDLIKNNIEVKAYKNNIYKIIIDKYVLIPNTLTPLERLLRYIEFGDTKTKGIRLLNYIKQQYTFNTINSLFSMYMLVQTKEFNKSQLV